MPDVIDLHIHCEEDLKISRGINDLQVSWVGSLTRQNSLSSSNCPPTPSQHQQLTPQNSLSSYHSIVYNGGRGGHSSSLQYDDSSKPINNLTARGKLFIMNVSHCRNVGSYLAQLAWYLGFSYEWKFWVWPCMLWLCLFVSVAISAFDKPAAFSFTSTVETRSVSWSKTLVPRASYRVNHNLHTFTGSRCRSDCPYDVQ